MLLDNKLTIELETVSIHLLLWFYAVTVGAHPATDSSS